MKTQTIKVLVTVFVVSLLLGIVTFGVLMWRIHQSVLEYCAIAQQAHPHPDDNVTALSDFISSGSHSLRDRNLAIWTLGRLGDSKALPFLEALYIGEKCDHNRIPCQYELEKAIKRCGGIPSPPRKTKH